MIPNSKDLIVPILELVVQKHDIRFRELRAILEKRFGLTPLEREERTESGEFVMSAQMHRAIEYLRGQGLVMKFGRVDHQPTERARELVAAGRLETVARQVQEGDI